MEEGNILRINCGLVVSGSATDIDLFLKSIDSKGLKLLYKHVSLGRIWINSDEQNSGGKR